MRWMLVALSAVLVGCGSQKTIPQVRTVGINAYAEGDYEAARGAYQEIVARQPSGADDHYQLGRTLMALGRLREAREQFNVAASIAPREWTYWLALLDSVYQAGEFDELLSMVRTQVRDRGDWRDAVVLGEYLDKGGLKDEAEEAFTQAVELGGGASAGPYIAQARFYRTIGDQKRELKALRYALSFDLENPAVNTRIRELGQVPGPSLAIVPGEG